MQGLTRMPEQTDAIISEAYILITTTTRPFGKNYTGFQAGSNPEYGSIMKVGILYGLKRKANEMAYAISNL